MWHCFYLYSTGLRIVLYVERELYTHGGFIDYSRVDLIYILLPSLSGYYFYVKKTLVLDVLNLQQSEMKPAERYSFTPALRTPYCAHFSLYMSIASSRTFYPALVIALTFSSRIRCITAAQDMKSLRRRISNHCNTTINLTQEFQR